VLKGLYCFEKCSKMVIRIESLEGAGRRCSVIGINLILLIAVVTVNLRFENWKKHEQTAYNQFIAQ